MENTLLILDEPTTGLHLEDIQKLLDLFSFLIKGNTSIIIIEHHLEVIRNSDWIIDLGPHAGPQGGHLVAQGRPEDIEKNPFSLTGQMLAEKRKS